MDKDDIIWFDWCNAIEEFYDFFRCDITLLELGRYDELHNRGIYLEGEF